MADFDAHRHLRAAARRLPTYSARLALQKRARAQRSRKTRNTLLCLALGLLIGAAITGYL